MRSSKLIASATVAAAVLAALAYAGDEMTSLSYISYLERYATLQAADAKDPADAVVNMPVVTGDRLDTARGARVEVQLADGSTVWLDEFTTLDFDALAASRENSAQRTVLFLQEGTAAIELPGTGQGDETTRLDYPNGTLFLSRPGLYRFDLRSGELHVEAHEGLAELPEGVGSALLRGGQEAVLDASGVVQKAALAVDDDDFWAWVGERRHPAPSTRTAEVIGPSGAGRAAVLDSYGTWVYVDAYSSWAWRPYVQGGWTPYSQGRWSWTPVGWNWVSYEPWGWYPYHYGSWTFDASYGWLWCWDWVWGPSWVHWLYTPGYIGWCPRGYYDWQGWGHHDGGAGWNDGPGHHMPGRWSEVAYDFSGRVRLRDVDPRPWSIVPADQFTNSRLDRVRIDPARVLRDADGDTRGLVRSGPLVTSPSRRDVERSFDTGFRGAPDGRGTPDLGPVLGNGDRPLRSLPGGATLQPVRTGDLIAPRSGRGDSARGDGQGSGGAGDRAWSRPSGQPVVDVSREPRRPRSELGRGGAASPPAGSEVREAPGRTPRRGDQPVTAPVGRETPREPISTRPTRDGGAPRGEPAAPRARDGQSEPRREVQPPSSYVPPSARRPGYAARVRSYDDWRSRADGGASNGSGAGPVRERTYVVPTVHGERQVRVYAPGSETTGATAPQRRYEPRSAAQPGGSYSSRPQVREWTPRSSAPVTPRYEGSAPTRERSAYAPRSYAPRSEGSPSPRSYSSRSYSSPSAPSPRSYSSPSAPSPRSYSSPSAPSPRSYSAPSSPSSPRASAPSSAPSHSAESSRAPRHR